MTTTTLTDAQRAAAEITFERYERDCPRNRNGFPIYG